MKAKKLFAFMPLITACLSACGNSGSGGGTIVDRTLPTDDPTSEITITFWHCLGKEKTKNLESIISQFNTLYAGKYKVVADKLAGDYDDLFDIIKTRLADGAVPALAMGYPDHFASYIGKNTDDSYLLRLNNFINDTKFGYSKEELDDFVADFLQEGKEYLFDGYWSMPMYKSTEIVYYNAGYFAGANEQSLAKLGSDKDYLALYDAVDGNPSATDKELNDLKEYTDSHDGYTYDMPVTWDEMIQWARDVLADRKTEKITSTFYPFGYDSDANLLISQFMQRNIPYTVNDEASRQDTDKHFAFNNADAKSFVSDLVSYINEGLFVTKGTLGNGKYTNTYFGEKKLAMTIGSTGGSTYNVSANFTVKLAPVPYQPNGSNIKRYIQQGPSICFFNNDNDYIHKGAWLFYQFLADTENNCALALENSYDPVRNSSFQTQDYKDWIAKKDSGLIYAIPEATRNLRQYYMTSPSFVGSSEARTQVGLILNSIIVKGKSVNDAFMEAYNKACLAG